MWSPVAAQPQSVRGLKKLGEALDDSVRQTPRQAEDRGTKRSRGDIEDGERARDLAATIAHPGPVNNSFHYAKGELEWNHIGSGVFDKTFVGATRLRKIIRNMTSGKIIDYCIVSETRIKILNWHINQPDNLWVELPMHGALTMMEEQGTNVAAVFSPPKVTQEAALRPHIGLWLKPEWNLDLARNDPLTEQPWDLSKRALREWVRNFVKNTQPFMVIGSPHCTMFCPPRTLSHNIRVPLIFAKKSEK